MADEEKQEEPVVSDTDLMCPECGKSLKSVQGYVGHVRNKHGVNNEDAMKQLETAGYKRPESQTRVRSPRRKATQGIDKDTLLRSVFPKGMPPNAEIVQATGRWLDEADRLNQFRY